MGMVHVIFDGLTAIHAILILNRSRLSNASNGSRLGL